jgi:hypothetical protein
MTNTPIKWAAQLTHVREVSLLGTADLAFWKDRLLKEGLAPAERDGRAQVLIIAADAKFMGVCFREVSFSVLVSRPGEGPRQEAAFLLRAFNSCRFFAFCERVFFATPYSHADVRVSTSPASAQVAKGGEVLFHANMGAGAPGRAPSRSGDDGWEGPVFLPARPGKEGEGKLFFARLRGEARAYPFLPGEDAVTIRPSRDAEALQALVDSRFAGREWVVREDAAHGKSKTYKRAEVLAGAARGVSSAVGPAAPDSPLGAPGRAG